MANFRRKYLLFLVFLIISMWANSQLLNCPSGTLIVAVICKDGILISADSRASYTDSNYTLKKILPYAYSDSNRKIFRLGKFQIGITGTVNVGNTYWWDLIEKFNKTQKWGNDIETTFKNFRFYLVGYLKIPDSLLLGNIFILTGYENNKPVIMVVNSINSNGVKMNKITNRAVSIPCIREKLILKDTEYYCAKILSVLKEGYQECGKDWQLGVGGPLQIVKINSNNNFENLVTYKFKRYKSYYDFESSIISGKTKLIHFFPETEQKLIDILKYKLAHPKEYYFKFNF